MQNVRGIGHPDVEDTVRLSCIYKFMVRTADICIGAAVHTPNALPRWFESQISTNR
jgi:hypothetical protein